MPRVVTNNRRKQPSGRGSGQFVWALCRVGGSDRWLV